MAITGIVQDNDGVGRAGGWFRMQGLEFLLEICIGNRSHAWCWLLKIDGKVASARGRLASIW